MATKRSSGGTKNVFLNVPFDVGYERMFVALVASVVAARMVPRCAVELPERGQGQFARVLRLLESCQLSIHDLSRAGRFNMPFELGLAASHRERSKHEFVVLEAKRYRLARRLSDVRIDPLVHGNGPLKLIAVLTENLGGAAPAEVEKIYRALIGVLPELKRALRVNPHEFFGKQVFDELVSGAAELADRNGLFE